MLMTWPGTTPGGSWTFTCWPFGSVACMVLPTVAPCGTLTRTTCCWAAIVVSPWLLWSIRAAQRCRIEAAAAQARGVSSTGVKTLTPVV